MDSTIFILAVLDGVSYAALVFLVAAFLQIRSEKFHPLLYWAAIIASTTVGTTLADFVTRSLGIGYTGGSAVLLMLLLMSLGLWYKRTGRIDVASVRNGESEFYYWLTIMFSQTLGTALGDWSADTAGLGYLRAAAIFGALLLVIGVLYFYSRVSRTLLFWAAFILTRPLGAVVGDFLDKPLVQGGLELSRYTATGVLLAMILLLVFLLPQRAATRGH